MKSTKKLQAVFDSAKGDNEYYTFENFKNDAYYFIKDIKKSNVVMSMTVSRSGMMRKFNSQRYNMLLNICYHEKFNWEPVRIGGCGMDMHWHLLLSACSALCTKREVVKWHLNGACGSQPLL